jgi:hypothetical protein
LQYICITRCKNNHFRLKNCYFHARNTNIYKICELITGLYFPHFTTIRNQILQFYSFYYVLSSYGNVFRSSCLDRNFVYSSWNHPLRKLQPGEPAHPCDVHDRKISATIALTQVSILKRKNLQIFSCDSVYLFNLEISQYGFW